MDYFSVLEVEELVKDLVYLNDLTYWMAIIWKK
jgi:hypothetical protein